MGVINLTPLQSVRIFGWLRPRKVLLWTDVVDNEQITFEFLMVHGLTSKQLHVLQPSVSEWVQHGGLSLADIHVMKEWDVDAIRDLKIDLADLISLRWSASTMRSLKITYSDLCQLGLGAENMSMFGFTMLGWMSLGFKHENLKAMNDQQIARVFGMTRQSAERCLIDSGV